MRNAVAWVLGLGLAANGLYMLGAPAGWYAAVPGVVDTGPLNPHFVHDIGVAYLIAAAALVWFAMNAKALPAVLSAAAFITLHALVHLWDATVGWEHAHQLLIDSPTVFVPSLVAVWLVWALAWDTFSKGEKL